MHFVQEKGTYTYLDFAAIRCMESLIIPVSNGF